MEPSVAQVHAALGRYLQAIHARYTGKDYDEAEHSAASRALDEAIASIGRDAATPASDDGITPERTVAVLDLLYRSASEDARELLDECDALRTTNAELVWALRWVMEHGGTRGAHARVVAALARAVEGP